MNVQNENVRVLTKEEVIKLSNGDKRRAFLDGFESWGVWLDIPELNVQVYKAKLPNKRVIYVIVCYNIFEERAARSTN